MFIKQKISLVVSTFSGRYWPLLGLNFIVFALCLYFIGPAFEYQINLAKKPVITFFTIYFLSNILFVGACFFNKTENLKRNALIAVFVLGLAGRVISIPATPILEDDFYRYLFDGALTAHNINPFTISPADALKPTAETDGRDLRLTKNLAASAPRVLKRINYPDIRTIYPLTAQWAFGTAYKIMPWKMAGWRMLLILMDIILFYLLLQLLQLKKYSTSLIMLYWLNPFILKEIFNSGHMDLLLLPFLAFAILSYYKERPASAIISLGFAAGVKFWPVILLPLFLKQINWRQKRVWISVLFFTGFTTVNLYLLFFSRFDGNSAVLNYSTRWQANDAFFRLILLAWEKILPFLQIHPGNGQLYARIFVVILFLTSGVYIIRKFYSEKMELLNAIFWLILIMFLISPTQFPWYFSWLSILILFVPEKGISMLYFLLPLYYLRYYFQGKGQVEVFDNYIVFLEFLPIWIYLIYKKTAVYKYMGFISNKRERIISQ